MTFFMIKFFQICIFILYFGMALPSIVLSYFETGFTFYKEKIEILSFSKEVDGEWHYKGKRGTIKENEETNEFIMSLKPLIHGLEYDEKDDSIKQDIPTKEEWEKYTLLLDKYFIFE